MPLDGVEDEPLIPVELPVEDEALTPSALVVSLFNCPVACKFLDFWNAVNAC
jgi:hypothetical protein